MSSNLDAFPSSWGGPLASKNGSCECANQMNQQNDTHEFTLMGFYSLPLLKFWVTPALLLVYSFTIIENLMIIAVVKVEVSLHTPMYFFLCHFSFLECCYTTIIIPKTLHCLISDNRTILFSSCFVQLYIFISLGATECLLLATMAYDRYVAICNPLHYSTITSKDLCILLVFCSWLGGFLAPLLPTIFVSQLHFCSYQINHFFCDVPPILQLSCSRTIHIELSVSISSSTIMTTSFIVIVTSYIKIVWTIFIIPSRRGFQKTFSTCASHLVVVGIYYGSGVYMYIRPNSHNTLETNKMVALFYAVLTPMLNPIIYSLRNADVKMALTRFFNIKISKQ